MNKVVLIGRLTKDPEVKYSEKANIAIARFTVACERRNRKTGEHEADFIPCDALGKTAEVIGNNLSKGRRIAVSGGIRVNRWEDRATGRTQYYTSVLVDAIEFIDNKNQNGGATAGEAGQSAFDSFGTDVNNIPF